MPTALTRPKSLSKQNKKRLSPLETVKKGADREEKEYLFGSLV